MENIIFKYLLIGGIWTALLDYLLFTYSPKEEGLPSIGVKLIHIFFWPISLFLVIKNLSDR